MEKYAMVKSEVQPNGDIFLFYVDENGSPVESSEEAITTIDQEQLQQLQENYVLELPTDHEYVESTQSEENAQDKQAVKTPDESNFIKKRWLDEETEKLLIFYIDNKEALQNPAMKNHLWTVACKTMLIGKIPSSCEMKLRNLKRKYSLLHVDHLKNNNDPKVWPYYDLCHQAFQNDSFVQMMLKENGLNKEKAIVKMATARPEEDSTVVIKKLNKSPDEKVRQMLELYLQYKKEEVNNYLWNKKVWEKIAIQMGEDAEFWHKRFLNYKQHYIRMLEKRNESGAQSVVWPYMAIYDEIFGNDVEFKRKYGPPEKKTPKVNNPPPAMAPVDWNDTEKTVLVKYYFDCNSEFQDPSIPNGFLWNEVGRLLDKKPEDCCKKYEQMRKAHLMSYIGGDYDLRSRKPIAILFDNIISQEVEKVFNAPSHKPDAADLQWKTEKIDEMVQFLFDNIEMFKDSICHFVCWAAIAVKIQESIQSCKEQWDDLTTLYKSILNDKKEDPELQIDWRYIDIFDRIFDYGMDTKLLEGYKNENKNIQMKPKKIVLGGKPIANKADAVPENLSDLEPEEFDEKSSGKRARGIGDPKQLKILEYYLKYKDKFATTQQKKQVLWEALASTIGISAEQCAHRFRNLKQVYMAYIQREINKPDKPILWPYFVLCKKVFGYRNLKNKLKQGVMELGDVEEWTPREIKMIINYFGQNFKEIDSNADDESKWASLAKDINRSEAACRDKFLDLRKSYRKIITMMGRNPDCKVNWKYFKYFDEIYSKVSVGRMEVDFADENAYTTYELPANAIKTEIQDDDLQCIFVIPESEEVTLASTQIIIKNAPNVAAVEPTAERRIRWTNKLKITLLEHYLEYIESHKGKFIDTKAMWKEIGAKMGRTPVCCRTTYLSIKLKYKQLKASEGPSAVKKKSLYKIMHKILATKPKFVRSPFTDEDFVLKEHTTYTDVPLPLWKVEKALKYYLDHVEEFVNPKYEKRYAWITLAKTNQIQITKIFKKINYLKQFFNSETNEVNGEKFEFADLLKKILEKEFECKVAMGNTPEAMTIDEDMEITVWTDDDIEQLLSWYLTNLDKFKSPKYVPSYLWMEASNVLSKSAIACSKKMTGIRSQYSAMVKENPDALTSWRFYELCQKIYGTGKKNIEQEQQ